MTNEQAKKMLEAKLKCLIAETSGTNHDCNMRLCDGCSLNYEQGNMGEQKEALDLAIKALEQTNWIPVSERLPEGKIDTMTNDFEIVLCSTVWNDVRPYKFGKPIGHAKAHFWDGGGVMDDYVIAWMPLPQPYKADMRGD